MIENQFEIAKKEFKTIRETNDLPPQMLLKLEYLLWKITGLGPTNKFEDLVEQQKTQFDRINNETKISLFCSIINCLSGNDEILYFHEEKAQIKKEEILSMWGSCYLTCGSTMLRVDKKSGKKMHEFDLRNLRISNTVKEYKKRFVFGLVYNKKQSYLVGFSMHSVCERVHDILKKIIHEKVKKEKIKEWKKRVGYEDSIIDTSSEKKAEMYEQQYEQEKAVQIESKILEILKEYELESEELYILTKNEGDFRQFSHKNYPTKMKQIILIDGIGELAGEKLLSFYLKMNEWNPEIEEVKFLTKLAENGYLIQIRTKKYSLSSWPRAVKVVVKGVSYQNNSYLLFQSIEDEPNSDDTVKMKWNQIIEVCEDVEKTKILLTVVSDFDFRGFCTFDDSKNMGMKIMNNLKLINSFSGSKQSYGKVNYLFSFERKYQLNPKLKEIMEEKAHSEDFSIDLPTNSESDSFMVSEHEPSKIVVSDDPLNLIMYMIKNDPNFEVSLELITLIEQRFHEKYYLKHKFDQEIHFDEHRTEHKIEEPDHYLYQNNSWIFNEEEDAIFINTKVMEMTKDTIKLIIKQIGANIMTGKSIMNMSLPVEIFDSRSILERIAIGFGYMPKFLVPAASHHDPKEQIKYVISFLTGLTILHLNMVKPFNPILGQTFQCVIGGIPVYMEQVCHHPPITAVYVKTQEFKFYGNFHSHAEMGFNQLHGYNLSPLYIEFPKSNTFYEIKMHAMELHGLMFGEKRYRPYGQGFIHERNSNVFAEFNTGKDKKKVYPFEGNLNENYYYGGIFTVNEKFAKKFRECENKRKFQGLKQSDIIVSHSKMTGHWAKNLFFDSEKFRDIRSPVPNKAEFPQYVLPSDSNFRTDIILKRLGDIKAANQAKQVLQNIQRRDRKLREGKIKI